MKALIVFANDCIDLQVFYVMILVVF